MITNRLIATLLINNGVVVQTRKFKRTNMVGNAFTAVDFFNSWAVDEICILEISKALNSSETSNNEKQFLKIIEGLSCRCFVPLTVGGKIRSLDLAKAYLRSGADKVIVNSGAFENPDLVHEISSAYGSQCVVLSIDAQQNPALPSGYEVMVHNGTTATGADVLQWARKAIALGVGEIMINNVAYDGDKRGYDLPLVKLLSQNVSVPVIAMGGVGQWQDFVDGIRIGGAQAVAAGNIFHYTEHSTKKAKEFMAKHSLSVRPTYFYPINKPRRVSYNPFQGQ